jgi:hypothetical protein
MHAEIGEETETESSSEIAQYMHTCFMREKKSLEIVPSKIAEAHSCLQTRDRDRNVMGQVPGKRESQESHCTGISSISPLDTPKVMGLSMKLGWKFLVNG